MTLHWWMHWFWVTLWCAVITGIPLPPEIVDNTTSTYVNTESVGSLRESSYIKNYDNLSVSSSPVSPLPPLPNPSLLRENYRVLKSVGIIPPASVVFPDGSLELKKETEEEEEEDYNLNIDRRVSPDNNITILRNNNDYRVDREANDNSRDSKTTPVLKDVIGSVGSIILPNNTSDSNVDFDSNRSLSLTRKKESKVNWLSTGNKTASLVNDKLASSNSEDNERRRNSSNYYDDDSLAVLPLQEPIPTRFKLVLNRTKFIPSTNINDNVNDKIFNKSDDVEVKEDRLLATAASILQAISESPRLSRARSAFPGDYQQDEQQEQRQAKTAEKNGFGNSTNSSAMDIAAVTGSCLATVVLIGTMGSLGFVMYRRRYMNPPQTLNSDKCSNPDSSGYIDDSTIRDNSEEMYSLDNDSFLNSLEAMTIQNYWTDSVKHTKL